MPLVIVELIEASNLVLALRTTKYLVTNYSLEDLANMTIIITRKLN